MKLIDKLIFVTIFAQSSEKLQNIKEKHFYWLRISLDYYLPTGEEQIVSCLFMCSLLIIYVHN